jgi:hypothetical protein
MNPRRESRGLLDKTRVAAALEQAGVPTPRTLGVYAPPGSSYTHGPRVQTIEDLRGMLAGHLPSGIVCKPNGGFSGNDVYVFRTASPEGLIHLDGTAWSVEALFARLSRAGRAASPEDREGIWKIEARVAQHPELTSAVGQTLATVRVVTYARADGGVHLLPPVWKVPISDCGVDNLAYSRWLAPVGLDSGRVGPLVHRDNQARRVDHPTTGAMIEGLILPGWDEVAGLVRRATSQFPALRSLGCDVGLTADGPVIIEVNPWWGVEMIQAPRDRGIVHGEFADFLEEIGAGSVVAGREA